MTSPVPLMVVAQQKTRDLTLLQPLRLDLDPLRKSRALEVEGRWKRMAALKDSVSVVKHRPGV